MRVTRLPGLAHRTGAAIGGQALQPARPDRPLDQAPGDLIDRARLVCEPAMITRYGKRAAILPPVGWYEEAEALMSGGSREATHGPEAS